MRTLIWILAIVGQISFAAAQNYSQDAARLLDKYRLVQGTLARIEAFSAEFLGLPYGVGGPLGEGATAPYDQDPLYRFDTFDCTTFVETVYSLAMSHTLAEFEQNMINIRYENGQVDYVWRNHFPSLDWIPNNIANGLFAEINDEVLPAAEQRIAQALIDKPSYYQALPASELRLYDGLTEEQRSDRLQQWRSEGTRFVAEVARLNYLPVNTLVNNPALLNRIPHGTFVSMVRPNWDLVAATGTAMNVSHQGLLLRRNGTLFLRHAGSGAPMTVVDIPFLDYLQKYYDHPTLKGIHLLRPLH